MRDPRRLYRRLIESRLPTRMIAHLSVVSLVTLASAAGIARTQESGSPTPSATRVVTGFPSIVSAVRGGTVESPASTPSIYSLTAHPADALAPLDRGAPAPVPSATPLPTPLPTPIAPEADATPLPTPVAPDPEETPLAAPSDVGEVATATGPSTRAAEPAPAAGRLSWPVPGGSYSQHFHAGHLAVDIAAPYGSQIVAAQGGVVTSAGWRDNGGGNVISVDHGNGMVTVYNHLGSIWVSPGQYVGVGQGIGGVGCTGMCTGPHVHFEVIVNGIIDNPQRYF
ncbi:MAG: M23 family metallopeptidase [Chloroflexi bacterium]|nr:M23 family metallopeptidase [Chloroflexota bacterium]